MALDNNNSRDYVPMSSSNAVELDTFGGIRNVGMDGTSTASTQGHSHWAPSYRLQQFCNDGNGPWNSMRGTNQPSDLTFGNGILFREYRDTTALSECDTVGASMLPSDSGYGSMAKPSVGIPSVFGDFDRSAETQSITGQLSDIQLQGLGTDTIQTRDADSATAAWGYGDHVQSTATPKIVDGSGYNCEDCGLVFKTNSVLKKHIQRHTKPFQCDEPNCTRKDGFSTANDLTRHKQSVHNPSGTKYRCNLGACATKEKDWPRADNFRQHLKRVHKRENISDDDLEAYVHRREIPDTPSPLSPHRELACLEGYAAQVGMDTLTTPPWIEMENHAGNIGHLPGESASGGRVLGNPNRSNDLREVSSRMEDAQFSRLSPDVMDQRLSSQEPLHTDTPPEVRFSYDHPISSLSRPKSQQQDFLRSREESATELPCIQPTVLDPARMFAPAAGSIVLSGVITQDLIRLETSHQVHMDESDASHSSVSGGFELDEPDMDDEAADDLSASAHSLSSKPSASKLRKLEPDVVDSQGLDVKNLSVPLQEPMDLSDKDRASALLLSWKDNGILDEMMETLGYQKTKEPVKAKKAINPQASASESQVSCSQCSKRFQRRCELKKHMKRHEKPYGCTYPGCSGRFGSKNDWKRHENSQHFQLEVWRCSEKLRDSPDTVCGKVCHRRETFKYHLTKEHDIQDPKAIESKWDKCRVGRSCEDRFWCGFCQEIIEIKQKGGGAWTERFNHIDNHFSGRNLPQRDISQWKNVEAAELAEIEASGSLRGKGHGGLPATGTQDDEMADRNAVGGRDHTGSRKRTRDEDSGADRPNVKRARFEFFWTCCACNNLWCPKTTNTCLLDNCTHSRCERCSTERHRITEADEEP